MLYSMRVAFFHETGRRVKPSFYRQGTSSLTKLSDREVAITVPEIALMVVIETNECAMESVYMYIVSPNLWLLLCRDASYSPQNVPDVK